MTPERIRIDPREVVHETLDGEVILIALQTGCYYALDGSGAEVWDALVAGRSAPEVVAELEQRYRAEPGGIAEAVADLVRRLVEERLVVPVASNGSVPTPERPAAQAPADAAAFPPPVLHKFTDMQDFLLVDPIHDVDDAGWPHVRPA